MCGIDNEVYPKVDVRTLERMRSMKNREYPLFFRRLAQSVVPVSTMSTVSITSPMVAVTPVIAMAPVVALVSTTVAPAVDMASKLQATIAKRNRLVLLSRTKMIPILRRALFSKSALSRFSTE